MPDSELRPIHDDAHGSDLDHARDVLSAAYDGSEWHADSTSAPFSFRYSSVGDTAMTLRAIHFDGRLDGLMTPSDDFVVQWITRGTGVIDDGEHQIAMQPGRPQLWPGSGARFAFEDYDQRLVQVHHGAVEEVARERGIDATALQLDHTVTPDDRSMQIWKNSVTLISKTVLDRQASPLLHAEMSRLGALALLELYPVASRTLPDEVLLPRNAHIRRAVEYAHEHAHLPITSTDLATVASLSLRALQQAFQRHLGVSPNGFIRQVRLDRVRDALLQGDPSATSVRDVAQQWGFAHAGRFSAAYMERHGEYPRDTLRR